MPISIYPPILKSTQPPFLIDLNQMSKYNVYFTLQDLTVKEDIKHIQIRVVRQYDNQNMVDTNEYLDGIIYKNINLNNSVHYQNGMYFTTIVSSDLRIPWQAGTLYKIQLRFGNQPIYTSKSDFAAWKQQQIQNQGFSEWSTVMIVKAINEPIVKIQKAGVATPNTQQYGIEITNTPLFGGVYSIDSASKELQDKYRFILYEGNQPDIAKQLEDSGWLQHDSSSGVGTPDYHRFKFGMLDNQFYTVAYQIRTVNGYEQSAMNYTFVIKRSLSFQLNDIVFEVDDSEPYCSENGCMNIYLSSDKPLNGCYVITRTSEKSNYEYYEDIKYLLYNQASFPTKTLIFQDFTIESGVKYKYAIQQENQVHLRTVPVYDERNLPYRMVNFEYAFLYHDDIQLRLKFNNNMSSFKNTVLTSKQDTLGDRYPHLVKNGNAYYAEFPITGLISLEMDSDQTFFIQKSDGYYYKDQLVIPIDKYIDNDGDLTYDRNLTHNNIFVERIFREKVEEFLNNFDYKLYKSPTERNMVVVLSNVSLTPKQELGRMIYEFSCTAYEVLENTIDNLNEYRIINVGEFARLETEGLIKSFGQIHGLYDNTIELLDEIRKIEEVSTPGGYKTILSKILSFKIEHYPRIDFSAELIQLEAEKAQALNQGLDTAAIDKRISEYKDLETNLATRPITKTIVLTINNSKDIVIGIGKIYQLDDIDENITSIKLKYTTPIILDYICELRSINDVSYISSVAVSQIYGQISGIFTQTDRILRAYNFQYQNSPTARIYNLYKDKTIIYDSQGNIIKDNTFINLYKSMNIIDIIKEETKKEIEITSGEFTNYDINTDQWDNGTIYYKFDSIHMIDIEADSGTALYIGKKADGSDKTKVVIGPTSRYILNPSNDLILYVELEEPAFAIINYRCTASKLTKVKGGAGNLGRIRSGITTATDMTDVLPIANGGTGATTAAQARVNLGVQNKLSGIVGQVVGFSNTGDAEALDMDNFLEEIPEQNVIDIWNDSV